MNKYKDFTVEDFVLDKYFRQWAMGELPETDTFWQEFQLANFDKMQPIEQARTIVKSLEIHDTPISETELRQRIRDIEMAITPEITQFIPFYRQSWFRVAASIAFLVAAGVWFLTQKMNFTPPSVSSTVSAQKTEILNVSKDSLIRFVDGSTAFLKKGGSIQFDKSFSGSQRVVTLLAGEAFFEVAKNSEKPFLVYANELVTKVLGTSFTVKTHKDNKEVTVEVKTGKVSVFTQKEVEQIAQIQTPTLKGLVLTPNQKIIFNKVEAQMTKTLVANPEIVLSETTKKTFNFDFEDTPANEVFRVLKEAYSINIVFDESILKGCPITAPLTDQPLFDKLKIICETINAQYEVFDGQIVILSKGCKN
jgi:transmembrane sensor